jgi:hypothetical protein
MKYICIFMLMFFAGCTPKDTDPTDFILQDNFKCSYILPPDYHLVQFRTGEYGIMYRANSYNAKLFMRKPGCLSNFNVVVSDLTFSSVDSCAAKERLFYILNKEASYEYRIVK